MSISLQPAFILHRRHYRETSLIVELFTPDHGRIAAVARGVRRVRSRTAPLLQPFIPLWVSWYGKGELVTLTQIEPNGTMEGGWEGPSRKNLRCGFYLNELLMRLLPKQDPQALLFTAYQQTIASLRCVDLSVSEKVLRLFEKKLLAEIGYGLPLKNAEQFVDEQCYYFCNERGFLSCIPELSETAESVVTFSGKTLNALRNEHFDDQAIEKDIKRLMRLVFSFLLGGKPLESRKLFM